MTVLQGPAHDSVAASGWRGCTARGVLWLAAASCGTWCAGAAQPTSTADSSAVTEPLLARIEQEEARSGPFSRDLIELFVALGLAYQEYGDHDLAIVTLDHALYLMRFNEGLHSLDQAPLLERLVASQLELGQVATAEELRQRVLELARRNMDDPRSVPIFGAEAERQIDLYERYLTGELHPPFTITVNGPDPNQYLPWLAVSRARGNYMAAIAASIRSGSYQHAQLAEFEEGIARSYYLQASALTRSSAFGAGGFPPDQRGNIYAQGRASYGRRTDYLRNGASTALDHARALVEQADWALLFSRNGKAVDSYAEAYELLLSQGAPAPSIQELFPVDRPVLLPTFEESPFTAVSSADASSYVDVDFEVSRYGEARKIRVVGVGGDASAAAARRVASMIARSRFRPRPLAEPPATEYRLRYLPDDGTLTPRL